MDPRTVEAAEQQMRRTAPDEHTAKRRKIDGGESSLVKFWGPCESASVAPGYSKTEQYVIAAGPHQIVARYNYTSVKSLQEGSEGFIVTCPFRK